MGCNWIGGYSAMTISTTVLKTLLAIQNWIRALQSNPTMTETLMTVMLTDGGIPQDGAG